jgi:hypothetical protein
MLKLVRCEYIKLYHNKTEIGRMGKKIMLNCVVYVEDPFRPEDSNRLGLGRLAHDFNPSYLGGG